MLVSLFFARYVHTIHFFHSAPIKEHVVIHNECGIITQHGSCPLEEVSLIVGISLSKTTRDFCPVQVSVELRGVGTHVLQQ